MATIDDIRGNAYHDASLYMQRKHGPGRDDDWRRVWDIARREYTDDEAARAVEALSSRLAKGSGRLRPLQALALVELATYRGLLAAVAVGGGKTLISLLAPLVTGVRDALLVLPAKLERKTHAEVAEYRKEWNIPPLVTTISVERLARKNQADYLDATAPGLIVIDEAHKLANRKAAATKRLDRYIREHNPVVAVLTGTLTSETLEEYAHLVRWALGDDAPVPHLANAIRAWGDALREPPKSALGAFAKFGDVNDARAAYRDRLRASPGVIVSTEAFMDVPLTIRESDIVPSDACQRFYAELEEAWTLPDGQEVADPLAMSRHAYTIALGYWLKWRVPGPDAWMTARSEWARLVRETIKATERSDDPIDTEEQCAVAIRAERFGPAPLAVLEAWKEIRPTFTPETIVEWIDESAVDAIVEWMDRPGIVWYRHQGIRDALRLRGAAVYGRLGEDAAGRLISNAPADIAVAASVSSSGEGMNLQQFNRSLVLEPPRRAKTWEQLLGRTHRENQQRPVTYEVYTPFKRHRDALEKARAGAEYVYATTGAEQKLRIAQD